MNMMMFPRMLASHDAGWAWLLQVHPSVTRMFFRYVVPMSLLPPAMILYAANAHPDILLGNLALADAWSLAGWFYAAELAMVLVMGYAIQFIGDALYMRPDYHDAYAFAAVAPTPLWLAALAMLVPSVIFNVIVTGVALAACCMLIYEGTWRVFSLQEGQREAPLLTYAILFAGLLAWLGMMGLVEHFTGWLD